MTRMVWGPVCWVVLCGFYLFLAGSLDAVEIGATLVCATAGVAVAIALSFVAKEHLSIRPPARAILKPLSALVTETFEVGRILVRVALRGAGRHEGGFVRQRFDFGHSSRREAGRRAVALIGVSLAPGSFVVRGEPEHGTVLLHGLPEKAPSTDVRWST